MAAGVATGCLTEFCDVSVGPAFLWTEPEYFWTVDKSSLS